ncbi:GM23679 [Drosophila sechellia]|uniref:GM23679 n=1 Tax=Drosophila sechellia TaxID=7238 RepID=B4HM71_DROSE|nr:GM23679 [Drosophila sechellia]
MDVDYDGRCRPTKKNNQEQQPRQSKKMNRSFENRQKSLPAICQDGAAQRENIITKVSRRQQQTNNKNNNTDIPTLLIRKSAGSDAGSAAAANAAFDPNPNRTGPRIARLAREENGESRREAESGENIPLSEYPSIRETENPRKREAEKPRIRESESKSKSAGPGPKRTARADGQ